MEVNGVHESMATLVMNECRHSFVTAICYSNFAISDIMSYCDKLRSLGMEVTGQINQSTLSLNLVGSKFASS